ncbi:Ig-like domain-containing protein, partial [Cochleicola gelatinilyticus]|uniref:Ig-like domain-containing protein n=1 Tax=Cochleicola gelatinilyticus TaxID=1763537 RepID=UPI0018D38EB1
MINVFGFNNSNYYYPDNNENVTFYFELLSEADTFIGPKLPDSSYWLTSGEDKRNFSSSEQSFYSENFDTTASFLTGCDIDVPCDCTREVSDTDHCSSDEVYQIYLNNGSSNIHLETTGTSVWTECTSTGTARYQATARRGSENFIFDIYFSGATTTPPNGSPKNHTCLNANTSGWVYYTEMCGTFKSSTKGNFTIERTGEAFQIGHGANITSNSLDFGGSGWFNVTSGNGYYTHGDFNLMLSENVTCPNNGTGATDDINSTFEGVSVSGNVLLNDIDPEDDELTLNLSPVSGPSNGSIVFNENGSYTYTPNPGFIGEDLIVYEVCDDGTPSACGTAKLTINVLTTPPPRDCTCSPFYENGNFRNPQRISGSNLAVNSVYRFSNVFPDIDALVKIVEFSGGASLLEMDVTSTGIPEAFQPRINSTNNNNQSVLFNITFVEEGGNYGDEVLISFFGTPFDIDGDSQSTREYAELSLPDAYFLSANTLIDITQNASSVRGQARNILTAPGGDISTDPRFTYSNYWENKSSLNYRVGKIDGNSDRYYSLNMNNANYTNPESVLITYPVICGNVSDDDGNPLANVEIDVTGSDGSSVTVQTDNQGHYMATAFIPEALVDVTYEIRENDPDGYVSVSDVDGDNDNLITRVINLASTCGNDFVDGPPDITGWEFECGDNKTVDEYGYNANGNTTTTVNLPDSGNIYQYVVETVYKGGNPGPTIQIVDDAGVPHTLVRTQPSGTSTNIWVYRGLIVGSTSTVTYSNNSQTNNLQSVVVYAFRNVPDASSNSGVFTDISGLNDIQSFTIDIPAFSGPRDLVIETPISELTNDGRYLLLKAEAGGVTDQEFLYGSDPNLPGGTCCLAIPMLTLENVPGNVTQVTITVDTRNGQNGQTVNGQSWIIAGGVNVDADCFTDIEITVENKDDILCNGAATGSITVSAEGGVPPFQYAINGGTPQDSPTFNGLVAGVYNVTITDSVGNNESISVTLTEPEAIVLQITKVNATQAQGCQNGEATVAATGGTPPFEYLWSASAGSQTTPTATNLPSGTHTVTVTDANGCEVEQGVVIDCINNCDAVIGVDNVTNVLCAGELTGGATVSATSIANPGAAFTFVWNTTPPQTTVGATSSTITGLAAGVYTVSVTIDGTVCLPVEQSVTISEPTNALNVTAASTDLSGPSTNDGTATANPTGGTPPYTYSWSPGGATTQTISGLSPGNYTVTVTDANGCTDMATTTVNAGTCQGLDVIASSTPVTCNGDSDGTATAGVNGGVGPFTYFWAPGGETTQTISGLTGGTYTVTVTDTFTQCTSQSTTTVNEPGVLSSGIAVTNINCFGENTGSLDLTVTGGTQPYSFAWSPNGETTEDLTNLVAGTYSVLITDANGCTTTASAEVLQPSSGLEIDYTVTDVLCNGELTGAIDITVTGGTPSYSYSWNNGETTEDLTDIAAGSYTVMVTDSNGCSVTEASITVGEPSNPLSIQITKENATTAQGCTDGEATATVTGGTPPYTYVWSASAGGQTTATATDLPAGTHTITVTDKNGCVSEQSVVIDCSNTCDAIIAIDEIIPVLCTGDDTGTATASASSVSNPNATFTFTWNTTPQQVDSGVTSSTVSGLTAGIYTVSVTIDGTVCQPVEQSVTITEPSNALNVSVSSTDESGPATGDGTATANVSGGTPPYTYVWAPNGETTQTIENLSAGTYTVTVTDANGCMATASTTVNSGTCRDLAVSATATPVTCNGDSDGTANATISGGVGPFTYSWAPGGETTQSITGLSGGTYTVTVTDTFTQCTAQATTTVNEPGVLSSGIAISNVNCFGDSTGSLDLTVTGGTQPYTFVWSPNGETTEDLINLTAGTYSVVITDANGCTTTNSAEVIQPDNELSISIIEQTENICNVDGSVTVEAAGGTQPYLYALDGGTPQANGTFTGLAEGDYTIIATDAAGCTIEIDITILSNCTDAISDINNTYVDTPVNGNVLTNDEDAEGDNQLVTSNTNPSNGTVTIQPNGDYTYTPNPGYIGEDTFEYTICDDGTPEACDTTTVYIEVLPLNGPDNQAPIANADTNTTLVDIPVSGTVLSNDFDPDGDEITVTDNTDPVNGTVVV